MSTILSLTEISGPLICEIIDPILGTVQEYRFVMQ